jgi:hypothetical protein
MFEAQERFLSACKMQITLGAQQVKARPHMHGTTHPSILRRSLFFLNVVPPISTAFSTSSNLLFDGISSEISTVELRHGNSWMCQI